MKGFTIGCFFAGVLISSIIRLIVHYNDPVLGRHYFARTVIEAFFLALFFVVQYIARRRRRKKHGTMKIIYYGRYKTNLK